MAPLELCTLLSQAFLLVLGAGLSALGVTWRLYRTTRFLKEALARQQRSGFEQQQLTTKRSYARWNALQKSLLERFLREPVPTLSDLVERTEREFSARESTRPSTPPPAPRVQGSTEHTIEVNESDFIRR